MSQHRIYGCKWDFCALAFRTLPDLDQHLQKEHVATARKEECLSKRRRVARGVYIKLSSQPLADQIPLRYSQTTGDITITTTTDLTFSTDSPLYPPSFPSQPPTLPHPHLYGRSDDIDVISLYTHGGSPSNSPPPPTSHLPGPPTQFDLPTTSSPFEPPTQAFQPPNSTQSTQSSSSPSQEPGGGATGPSPPPPGIVGAKEKIPVSPEDTRRKRTSSGNSIPLAFGQSPARHRSSPAEKDRRKTSGGSEWSVSSGSVTFAWGLGSTGQS